MIMITLTFVNIGDQFFVILTYVELSVILFCFDINPALLAAVVEDTDSRSVDE